jgi:hypothetical protein
MHRPESPAVFLQFIELMCGILINGILITCRMDLIKLVKFIFQQHNNAQYRISTISMKLFMG